jgi:hypothetical protein
MGAALRSLLAALLLWASPSYTVISPINDGGYTNSATSPVTLTKPIAISGDLLLMFVTVATNTAVGSITTPAGWTFVTNVSGAISGGFNNAYLFYKVAGNVEPSTYSVSYGSGGTFSGLDGEIRSYRGTDTSVPINSSAVIYNVSASVNTVIPSVTETFVPGEWYAAAVISYDNTLTTSQSPTTPGDIFTATGVDNSYTIGDFIPTAAPPAETFVYAASIAGRIGIAVTIEPRMSSRTLGGVGR